MSFSFLFKQVWFWHEMVFLIFLGFSFFWLAIGQIINGGIACVCGFISYYLSLYTWNNEMRKEAKK